MFTLPNSIQLSPHLSSTLKNFLRALEYHCGSKNVCWPSQSRIANFMNCSIRTVQRAEREAVELKFIEVERRWLRSNKYKVLCLEERQLSTMATQCCRVEQTTSLEPRTFNGNGQKWKSPAEIKILIQDIGEVFGPEVLERNRGWFYKIARTLEESWIYEALSWVRQALVEAHHSGQEIRSPSALFTWRLRSQGAPI